MRRRLMILTVAVLMSFGAFDAAMAHPFRGSVHWSVLLCKYTDSGNPPKSIDFYTDMFIRQGTGGLDDYWRNISLGSVNFEASVVKGWYTEPMTVAQAQAKAGGPNPHRGELVDDCVAAARNAPTDPYTVPSGDLVAVITFPAIDQYGGGGRALLPDTVDVGAMAHEVGHGLGLNHSFSDDPNFRDAPWAQIGEYDDQWDVMSYANVFARPTERFGNGGPGLNAHHMDRMGWLPRSRIMTFGADGVTSGTATLAALAHPEATGAFIVRVPFDASDLFHYYTVEYRRKAGWDTGFPGDVVLIHETVRHDDGQYYSTLIRDHSGARNPVQSMNANGVSIAVVSISGDQATVNISSQIADHCLEGFVWREASPSDHVCVTPAVRQQARNDNAQSASRRNPGGGPSGPDTCVQGFVWREAFSGDHVCVTPEVRSQARSDNAIANSRHNPARSVFGPNTCKSGLVWREADDADWVCVPPAVRTQTRNDNAQAAAHRNPGGGPSGPDTCVQGFVWREAFPSDHVCVTPQTRSQAASDNQDAPNRLLVP
jgi:hypothetical protein